MKNPPEKSTIINVCIIPPPAVAAQCVAISQSLKSDATMFALDGMKFFAHMTVYMARFADEKIPTVIASVSEALKGFNRFACDHVGYFMNEGSYLEVSYRKSAELLALQEALISHVAVHRINPGNPYEEAYFTPYTQAQQLSALETGYDLVRGLYRPHITLTRYHEGRAPEEFPGFPPAKLSFALSTVAVCKANENGAVYEEMAKFTL